MLTAGPARCTLDLPMDGKERPTWSLHDLTPAAVGRQHPDPRRGEKGKKRRGCGFWAITSTPPTGDRACLSLSAPCKKEGGKSPETNLFSCSVRAYRHDQKRHCHHCRREGKVTDCPRQLRQGGTGSLPPLIHIERKKKNYSCRVVTSPTSQRTSRDNVRRRVLRE